VQKPQQQILAYTSICHGLVHVFELTFGVVLAGIAQDFGVGLFMFGVLANIFGLAFGTTSLPSGYLADRMSERRLLAICCFGMAASAAVVSLSPNIYVLGAGLLALGIAVGILHPTGTAYVTRVTSKRGQGLAYFGIGGNLGIALGPVMAGAIAGAMGWRASYLVFAVPAIILGAMFHFAGRAEAARPEPRGTGSTVPGSSLKPFATLLALVFSAQVLNGFTYRGTVTFLPTYLSRGTGFTLLNMDAVMLAGTLTTVALIFGAGGIYLGGYLADRRRPEILAVIIAAGSIPLLLLMSSSTGLPLITSASAFAFVYFAGLPVYNFIVAEYSPDRWRGRMYGVSFFCSFGAGSFSASLLGYIAERVGASWIFIVLAGFQLLVLMLVAILLAKTRSRQALS